MKTCSSYREPRRLPSPCHVRPATHAQPLPKHNMEHDNCPIAVFLVPLWGEAGYGVWLPYRLAKLRTQAGGQVQKPEDIAGFVPQPGTKN